MTANGVWLPADDGVLVMIRRLLRATDPAALLADVCEHPPHGLDVCKLMETLSAIDRTADQQTWQFMESQRETAARIDQLPADSQWHTKDVADYTGLSKRSVQQYAPEMGGVRVGRRWRFDRTEVTTWWGARLLCRNAL
jgi:excisionase family DNA binding protein